VRTLKKELLDPFLGVDSQSQRLGQGDVLTVYGEIPEDIQSGVYLSINRKGVNGIHSLGNPQPAKFIPEVPRWAVRKFLKKGQTVLDPFVGSGTTMVEARILGVNSYGIDHNPLARLLSKVKSTPLEYSEIVESKRKLQNAIFDDIILKDVEIPEFRNRDFWFDHSASEGIAVIRNCIEREMKSSDIKDFFIVVLSEIIQQVSRVGSGQILPAKRSKNGEKARVTRKEVCQLFLERLNEDTVKMREFSAKADRTVFSEIVGDDARKISTPNTVDLIVTSPPYINSHHYIWTNKLRLLQLRLIDDEERLQLMRKEIGTEEFSTEEYKDLGKTDIEELDKRIEQIYQGDKYKASGDQNRIRARSVFRYFSDMKTHLAQAFETLRPDSHYVLVVGNNKICKVDIPTPLFLEQIAREIGFNKILQFQIILKNRTLNLPRNVPWADITLYDQVLVLRRV